MPLHNVVPATDCLHQRLRLSPFYGRMSDARIGFWQDADGAFARDALDVVWNAIDGSEILSGLLYAVRLQPWSEPNRHLSARWRPTGEEVVLKLDVGEGEFRWTKAIASVAPELVPQLFASGTRLGNYDVRWVLHERVPWTLSEAWPNGADVEIMIDTGVRFQKIAGAIDLPPDRVQSELALRQSFEVALEFGAPPAGKALLDALSEDWAWLVSTFGIDVIYGDLITPNVGVRVGPPDRSAGVLLDIGSAHAPWPFEAAWPEGKNGQGYYRRLIPQMAKGRAQYGLTSGTDDEVERAGALVMGWNMLSVHYARPRDPRNCPPQGVIDEYLAAAVRSGR